MDYNLAKQLKDSGFKLHSFNNFLTEKGDELVIMSPTLSELIEACGDKLSLWQHEKGWSASKGETWNGLEENYCDNDYSLHTSGSTPEEAVAKLWLELNK